ncbi:MAG: 2-oxoadipate dioxygenase/decarboxylase [Pseudonocardia sp.]
MRNVSSTQLRARFAAALSALYATEVPASGTLVEVAQEVNERFLAKHGAEAERLGSIERVTAERHGAIRVGNAREMAQVARVFGALGMAPVGFYDLRDAAPRPIPVVSTAFRPLRRDELAANPFRVFTSMLVPEDRRFFDADLTQRLRAFLDTRRLFPDELLDLAATAERHGELPPPDAARFLELATAAFALSAEPVDRGWYTELERISGVAADIGGVTTTHINHLTPRVLDIDDLYRSMQERGIEMIDLVQGPPRWDGPDVLLRQTSFRALAEPRRFRDADGALSDGDLRVRFGEVEARGIALTPAGRDLYDSLTRAVDEELTARPDLTRQAVAERRWQERMPRTERELHAAGLGHFTYHLAAERPPGAPPRTMSALVDAGWVEPRPIVYEDFLPRSAAGIFASNLTADGSVDAGRGGAERNAAWLSDAIGRPVHSPEELYAAESAASAAEVMRALGVPLTPR